MHDNNSAIDFEYLKNMADRFGTLYFIDDFEAAIRILTESELAELRDVYQEVSRREDWYEVSRWIDASVCNRSNQMSREVRQFAARVGQLFVLFRRLEQNGIEPFASERRGFIPEMKPLQWDKLPGTIRYVGTWAEHFDKSSEGHEPEIAVTGLSNEDLVRLEAIAVRIRDNAHLDLINRWIDEYDMMDHRESWLVYRLLGMLDAYGML